MATETQPLVGLYRVCLEAGKAGTPGAPILHLYLLVNAPTGKITGQGSITQAVTPPGGNTKLFDLTGQLFHTGLGKYTMVFSLKGHGEYVLPPPRHRYGSGPVPLSLCGRQLVERPGRLELRQRQHQ